MADEPTTYGKTSDDDVLTAGAVTHDPATSDQVTARDSVDDERPTGDTIPRAIVAALIAAIVSGIAWGYLTLQFNSEWGFFALGVGFLVGLAILHGTGQRKGRPLQVIAVVGSLLGIAFGKYMIQILDIRNEFGDDVSYFQTVVLEDMVNNFDQYFGLFDLLWVGLAVYTAWNMLEPSKFVAHPAAPVAPAGNGNDARVD